MEILTFEVTQDDVKQGRTRDAWRCPIALSTKRATGKSTAVGTGILEVGSNPILIYELCAEAQLFIQDFDMLGSAQPGTFTAKFLYTRD